MIRDVLSKQYEFFQKMEKRCLEWELSKNHWISSHFHFFEKKVIKSSQNPKTPKENEFQKSEKHEFSAILASNRQLF